MIRQVGKRGVEAGMDVSRAPNCEPLYRQRHAVSVAQDLILTQSRAVVPPTSTAKPQLQSTVLCINEC